MEERFTRKVSERKKNKEEKQKKKKQYRLEDIKGIKQKKTKTKTDNRVLLTNSFF